MPVVLVLLYLGYDRLGALVRWRGLRITVHQGGVAFAFPGQGSGRYRWDEIAAFDTLAPEQRAPGGSRPVLVVGTARANLVLRFTDGRTAYLPLDTVEKPANVVEAIAAQSEPSLLERARTALARGDTVDFGELKATPRGGAHGGVISKQTSTTAALPVHPLPWNHRCNLDGRSPSSR